MELSDLLVTLNANPGSILAWEVDEVGQSALSAFRVDGGTAQLAYCVVADADRPRVAAELADKGLVVGSYAGGTGVVWLVHEGTLTVWGRSGRLFQSDGKRFDSDGGSLAVEPGMEVIAFVDDSLILRGVKLRTDEREHIVASHAEPRAVADFTYGPLDALVDCGWTVYLGRDLADFLGAPFVDRTG